jgi:hypothetical protein
MLDWMRVQSIQGCGFGFDGHGIDVLGRKQLLLRVFERCFNVIG